MKGVKKKTEEFIDCYYIINGLVNLNKTQLNDSIKDNNINLLRIKYTENIEEKLKLLLCQK